MGERDESGKMEINEGKELMEVTYEEGEMTDEGAVRDEAG